MKLMSLSKPQTAVYEMDWFGVGSIANITGDLFINEEINIEVINKRYGRKQ